MTDDDRTDYDSSSRVIRNVFLAFQDHLQASKRYDITIHEGMVINIEESVQCDVRDHSLLIPSFTHCHVHLDKCYIMDRSSIVRGTFEEALETTAAAKSKFAADRSDLLARGERLIRESVQFGVTSMRAHVEVDSTVQEVCLEVALCLKESFRDVCDIQISVFAQDPLFNKDGSCNANYKFFEAAAAKAGVTTIGSAPYVEKTGELSKANIVCVLSLAQKHNLLIDFHLDYNLEPSKTPMIHEVIRQLKERNLVPPSGSKQAITIGHATRLGLMTSAEWCQLKHSMANLPIHFIGLPQSDLYMMGRQSGDPGFALRGTLNVLRLKNEHDLSAALSINNIQNAFTPQGSADPLLLCTLGVAIFQSASANDCRSLLEAVSTTAKHAIGEVQTPSNLAPAVGDHADFVILHKCSSVAEAVLNPPHDRTVIKGGKIVSRRKAEIWMNR